MTSVTEKREYKDDYPDKTLYIPGPTEVREDVIEEMSQPMFGHRMDRMTDLYTTIVEDTKEFLGTDNEVIILTGSGTEFMESSILNLVDENVLVTTCGSFSERQANVAERLGKSVDTLEYEWGQAVKPEDVRERLEESDTEYDVVTCVMNESSTGVRNPIEEIGDVVAEFEDTYFVVDAVSALGGDLVEIDDHDIDVIFTSVQKAFAMPPGLSGLCRQRRRLRARTRERLRVVVRGLPALAGLLRPEGPDSLHARHPGHARLPQADEVHARGGPRGSGRAPP